MGGVTQKNGLSANYRIDLSTYRDTLRGRVLESAGFSKSIVEVWMYPDTWKPQVTMDSTKMSILSGKQCEKKYVPVASID